jgi:hypothetical protein
VTSWWYVANGERKGPVSQEGLHRLLDSGTITTNSLIWKAGMKDWQKASQIVDLAHTLHGLPPEIPTTFEQKPSRWRQVVRHLGSSVAFLIGCLAGYWLAYRR